jgi:hypothetical protein
MKKEIEVAVNWWAEQLRQPPKMDNGDSVHNMLGNALVAQKYTPVTEDQIERFRHDLTKSLHRYARSEVKVLYVGVDYSPDGLLSDALSNAGIDGIDVRLPWKTHMNVCRGMVTVAVGYRGAWQVLYEEKQ